MNSPTDEKDGFQIVDEEDADDMFANFLKEGELDLDEMEAE